MKRAVVIMLMITSFLLAFTVSMETQYRPPGGQEYFVLDHIYPAIVPSQYHEYEEAAVLPQPIPSNLNPMQENVTQDRTLIYIGFDLSNSENYYFT